MEIEPLPPESRRVLFFSRGRGRGHAVPDAAAYDELLKIRKDLDLRFVSYGTGAKTLQAMGLPSIDLGFTDFCPAPLMTAAAGKLIRNLRPEIVISHEEYGVLPAAKIDEVPTLYVTDWFEDADSYSSECLLLADRILFLGSAGKFEEPSWVKNRVRYVGMVVREFAYRRSDRERARRELGLDPDTWLVLTAPGSWSETIVPVERLVIDAFDQLPQDTRRLIWLAGEDAAELATSIGGREDVTIVEFEQRIDRLFVAADVIVTKGSRLTIKEITSLGLPAIALMFRENALNPMDLKYAEETASVELIGVEEADAGRRLTQAMGRAPNREMEVPDSSGGAKRFAEAISDFIDQRGAPR